MLLQLLNLWVKVLHQGLELAQLDRIRQLRLAQHSNQTRNLQLCQLLDTDLVATREEIICRQDFHVLLVFEDIENLDHILSSKGVPHIEVLSEETLGDHVEDSLGNVQHLIL